MRTPLLLMLLSTATFAQQGPLVPKDADTSAQAALKALAGLVTRENAQRLGFNAPEEVQRAQLDAPMAEYLVRLDELQRFDGDDAEKLLGQPTSFLYPVTVEGSVRSSIGVAKQGNSWQAASFGSPRLVRTLAQIRQKLSEETKLPIASFFGVRVPSLNLYFVGHRANGQLMLTPVMNDPRFGLRAGETQPGRALLLQLVPAAKKHDGLPG